MSRTVLLTFGAILALGAASFAMVLLVTRGGATGSASGSPAAGAPGAGAIPAPQPPGLVPGPGASAPTFVPPHEQQAPPPPPEQGSWAAAPLIGRPRVFGRLGIDLASALEELQPAVAACANEEAQARFGPRAFTTFSDPSLDSPGEPTLMLEIETRAGWAVIVDAPVESQGTASDGLVSCAQAALRGRRLNVPEATPGSRYRMRFPLIR